MRKYGLRFLIIFLIAVTLMSCKTRQTPAPETTDVTTEVVTTAFTTVTATTAVTTEATSTKAETPRVTTPTSISTYETLSEFDIDYQDSIYHVRVINSKTYNFLEIRGVSSSLETLRIPTAITHCHLGLNQMTETAVDPALCLHQGNISQTKHLIIDEGFDYLNIVGDNDYFAIDSLEILEIPASLGEISFSSGPIIEAIMQQHYDTEKGAWSALAVKDGFRYAERVFPLSAKQLKEIRVTQGNPNYWDENGILFASQHLNGYIGTRTYPTHQLIKLPPQHTGNGDGTYRIPDGTDYIHSTAIYQCANLHTVYIPDSVTLIAPAAIIATAENPLTLICTAGSAAEDYVKQFGSKYHLILQLAE